MTYFYFASIFDINVRYIQGVRMLISVSKLKAVKAGGKVSAPIKVEINRTPRPAAPVPAGFKLHKPLSFIETEALTDLNAPIVTDSVKRENINGFLFLQTEGDASVYTDLNGKTCLNARPDLNNPNENHKKCPNILDLPETPKSMFGAKQWGRSFRESVVGYYILNNILCSKLHPTSNATVQVIQETEENGKPLHKFYIRPRSGKYKDFKDFFLNASQTEKADYLKAMLDIAAAHPPIKNAKTEYFFRSPCGALNLGSVFYTEYRPDTGFSYEKNPETGEISRFDEDRRDYDEKRV